MKKFALLLALAMVFSMLAGCSGNTATPANVGAAPSGSTSPSAGTATPTQAPAAAKPDTLVYATQQDFNILSPFFTGATPDQTATWAIMDSLFNMDTNGNFYPLVAEKWDFSEDGKEITFYIRKGIKFHNGTEVKASDVVFSADLMKNSPFKARVAALYDKAELIDDYTMKFILPQPAAQFMYELALQFAVYPEAYYNEVGGDDGFKNAPIGCGAYEFVSRTAGEGCILKAFPDYYGDKPSIENINLRFIPDASTALISLENGEIDLCQYVPAASYPLVESNPKLSLYSSKFPRVFNLILNCEQEPFKDNATLRQAFAAAIDKQLLVDIALEGHGVTATTLVNDVYIAAPKNIDNYAIKYDVENAKKLLAEAGYPDGKGLPSIKMTTIEMFKKQSEMIQDMLKQIGVTVEIDMVELSTYISMQSNREFTMGLMSTNQGGDASAFSAMLDPTSVSNGAGYNNPEVVELFKQASAIMDNEERSKVYEELYKKVIDDMPYISIYFVDTVSCSRADLNVESFMGYIAMKLMYINFK